MKWTEKKSVRYGSLSAGLTVAVIAVIIIFNVIVSALFSAFGTNLDMTTDNLFEVSAESHSLLEQINSEENNVTIYFLTEPDNLGEIATAANGLTSSGLWGMKYIHELALELADRYDFISVDYISPTNEPGRIREIVGDEYYESTSFGNTQIIIDNYAPERDSKGNILTDSTGQPSSYWHNFRLYSRNSFYGFNTSTYGVIAFKGDYRFCSAILSVTREITPVAYFLTGHGEAVGSYTVGEDGTDYGDAANLWNLLRDCGYNIRHIDLQYENFDMDEHALAIIFAPKSDFLADKNGSVSEIEKLKAFLGTSGHSLAVFMDPDTRSLPTLESFLEESAGIVFDSAKLKNNGSSSITVDGYSLVGAYNPSGNQLSDKLTSIAAESKVIFRLARAIQITDSAKAGAVYTLPEGTVAENTDGSEASVQEGALITFSQVSDGSYIMACGTSMLTLSSYTENPGYANRELICAMLGIASQDDTAYSVRSKVIPNEGLDLTTRQATVWTVVLSAGLPLIIAILGICVYVRRRHS